MPYRCPPPFVCRGWHQARSRCLLSVVSLRPRVWSRRHGDSRRRGEVPLAKTAAPARARADVPSRDTTRAWPWRRRLCVSDIWIEEIFSGRVLGERFRLNLRESSSITTPATGSAPHHSVRSAACLPGPRDHRGAKLLTMAPKGGAKKTKKVRRVVGRSALRNAKDHPNWVPPGMD